MSKFRVKKYRSSAVGYKFSLYGFTVAFHYWGRAGEFPAPENCCLWPVLSTNTKFSWFIGTSTSFILKIAQSFCVMVFLWPFGRWSGIQGILELRKMIRIIQFSPLILHMTFILNNIAIWLVIVFKALGEKTSHSGLQSAKNRTDIVFKSLNLVNF